MQQCTSQVQLLVGRRPAVGGRSHWTKATHPMLILWLCTTGSSQPTPTPVSLDTQHGTCTTRTLCHSCDLFNTAHCHLLLRLACRHHLQRTHAAQQQSICCETLSPLTHLSKEHQRTQQALHTLQPHSTTMHRDYKSHLMSCAGVTEHALRLMCCFQIWFVATLTYMLGD